MFLVNLKLSNRKIAFILFLFLAITVFAIALRIEACNKTEVHAVVCTNEEELRAYIGSFELELGECRVDNVTIPYEFNDVYNNYNDIQLKQGFNLAEYKGQTVERYTFSVLNHTDGQDVFAEVLIHNQTVIGADVYSTAIEGFISPLK